MKFHHAALASVDSSPVDPWGPFHTCFSFSLLLLVTLQHVQSAFRPPRPQRAPLWVKTPEGGVSSTFAAQCFRLTREPSAHTWTGPQSSPSPASSERKPRPKARAQMVHPHWSPPEAQAVHTLCAQTGARFREAGTSPRDTKNLAKEMRTGLAVRACPQACTHSHAQAHMRAHTPGKEMLETLTGFTTLTILLSQHHILCT